MNWILLDWGGADSFAKLGVCWHYCVQALDMPISLWGYTFSIAKAIYGITAVSVTAKFMKETTKILKRGSVD